MNLSRPRRRKSDFGTLLSSTLANFGTVGERILQALPGMAQNFFTVPGAAVTGKKSGVPYFSARSAQEPLQNWPKSSSDHSKGFVALPKRWIVERTLAWLNRRRRLAKDW